MAIQTIEFGRAGQLNVLGATVAVKENWADDWETVSDLHCRSVQWQAAPGIASANLEHVYGRGKLPTAASFTAIAAQTGYGRYFVRVTVECFDSDPLQWYGVFGVEINAIDGNHADFAAAADGATIPSGVQAFTAYGLEVLLDRQVITGIFHSTSTSAPERTDHAPIFNEGGFGNRSAEKFDGRYIFSGEKTGEFWTSRDIVEYLLYDHSPKNTAGDTTVQFLLFDSDDVLTNWDRPEINAHGHSVRRLLNQLIPRQRLASWSVEIQPLVVLGFPITDIATIRPFSFAEVSIDIPSQPGESIAANASQKVIKINRDPGGRAVVKRSTLDEFDQIIVQGARRRSCFSTLLGIGGLAAEGWSAESETGYEAAASAGADYPDAAEIDLRRIANAQARAAEKYAQVYSRFAIDSAAGQITVPGAGFGDNNPIFPEDDDPTVARKRMLGELRILPTLPLIAGRDYIGDDPDNPDAGKISTPTVADETLPADNELSPLVLFPTEPTKSSWLPADKVGQLAADVLGDEYTWSAAIAVDRQGGLNLKVTGQPQHILAKTNFEPLPEDLRIAEWDYNDAYATLALEDDRYCQGVWPEFPLAVNDRTRYLRIDAGPSYRQDWLVGGTIVGIDPETGELLRVSNDGGFLRDDSDKLKGIARIAFEWYGTTRTALSLRVDRPTSFLAIGDYILTIQEGELPKADVTEVASCLTSMAVSFTGGLEEPAGSTRVEYKTAFAELDPLAF